MIENLITTILNELSSKETINTNELDQTPEAIHSVLRKLESKQMITYDPIEKVKYFLTDDGRRIILSGSPEYNLHNLIPKEGIQLEKLKKEKIGLGHAFKNGWVYQKGELLYKKKENIVDEIKIKLEQLDNNELTNEDLKELRKRKLVDLKKHVSYNIKKGEHYKAEIIEYETEITSEMILSNSYKDKEFKSYNFCTRGKIPEKGNLHPLMKVKEEIKNIFIQLGFCEMRTDKYVESSFWNFDALFQPQDHPSRDAHDTFFVENEVEIDADLEYIQKIKNIHEKGGYGSSGYLNTWNINEAKKGILRTHTTSTSARYLYQISQILQSKKLNYEFGYNGKLTKNLDKNEYYKFFSIDKVFRNESVDATHLAEFHQIEGVIIGRDMPLGKLMGVLQTFYKKLGLTEIKFKPAFNPYTEPSMEIFAYHEGLEKWIEIGNSGIFRPEMLRPMGFDEDITVFGWGLSLERPTMIKYGIKNIRELVGHKVCYDFIKNSEICYF